MNFITSFKKGQKGLNQGLYMGDGVANVSKAINGLQKSMVYGLAAGPKAGKTTLCDYAFVIEPYLDSIKKGIEFEVIYNSYEIDRVSKEFDFAAHFLERDYGINHISLEEGVTKGGVNVVEMSSKYLRGRLQDDEGNVIKVKEKVQEVLIEVYQNRIIPLFGEYDGENRQIKPGAIIFCDSRNNPTGIRNFILDYGEKNGKFAYEHFQGKEGNEGKRIIGYEPTNPNKLVLIVTDHLRKLKLEKINNSTATGSLKQCIDKFLEYSVELRNWCGFSFLHIIHLNRSMTDPIRIKQAGDLLYPNGDDVKDSGNLSEEADFMFTMMNPNDERYNLSKHFGKVIKDGENNDLFPNMRTLHLVENRHGDSPEHFRMNMHGNVKSFSQLNIE